MKTKTPVNGLPVVHLGEFLRETLDELGLTQAAYDLKVAQVELKDSLLAVRTLAVA